MKEPSTNFLPEHSIYRGIHKTLWDFWPDIQKIQPHIFTKEQALAGLSVDWSKHTTPQKTLSRLAQDLEFPLNAYGIIEWNIGILHKVMKDFRIEIDLEHDPIFDNPAHTLIQKITKMNKASIERIMAKVAKWVDELIPNK